MTYSNKVKNALNDCKTLQQVTEVENAIKKTSQINRRTKAGRELTNELLNMCQVKAQQLIEKGELPF